MIEGRESKVFVVQEPMMMREGQPHPRFSLDPAREFGELVIVLAWSDTKKLKEGGERDIRWKIRHTLEDFTEDDFILMTGDWSAMALVVHDALLHCDVVKLLQWDGKEREYHIITIDQKEGPPSGYLDD